MSIGPRIDVEAHERVQQTVEEYLANGGKIQTVPFGVTGDPSALRDMKAAQGGHGLTKLTTQYGAVERAMPHKDEIVERYKAGESIRAIARSLRISDQTTSKILHRSGVKMQSRKSGRGGA